MKTSKCSNSSVTKPTVMTYSYDEARDTLGGGVFQRASGDYPDSYLIVVEPDTCLYYNAATGALERDCTFSTYRLVKVDKTVCFELRNAT